MENIQQHQAHHPIIDGEEEKEREIFTAEVEVNSSGHENDKFGNYSRYITIAKLAKKAISLNHDGVICLESNKIHAALKIFTAAFHTHEKLKVRMKTASSSPSSHPSLSTRNDNGSARYHDDVNDLFYRYRRASSALAQNGPTSSSFSSSSRSSSIPSLEEALYLDYANIRRSRYDGDENDEEEANASPSPEIILDTEDEIILRDSIRLPFYEDFPSCTFELQQQQDRQYHPAFSFLSTCHTLNLAIAHHLRGIQLLQKAQQRKRKMQILSSITQFGDDYDGDENEHTSHTSSYAHKHFDRAGHFYELTMRIEYKRSKLQQQRQKLKQCSGLYSNSWFSPQIVLACINNLGHLYYLMSGSNIGNKIDASHRYYQQLKTTVRKLIISTKKHSPSTSSMMSSMMPSSTAWNNLRKEEKQSNGKDKIDGDMGETGTGTGTGTGTSTNDRYSYLEVFWTNASKGLKRLLTFQNIIQSQHVLQNTTSSMKSSTTPRAAHKRAAAAAASA